MIFLSCQGFQINKMKLAQINFPTLENSIPGFRFAGGNFSDIVNFLIPRIFVVAGLLLLLYLIYGGFHFIISMGDPKGMQEARGKVTNALIGFIIVFLAYWIVLIIGKILGIEGFGGAF